MLLDDVRYFSIQHVSHTYQHVRTDNVREHLVMTNSLPWFESPNSMVVSSWEHHLFLWAIYTMATLNNQRVMLDTFRFNMLIENSSKNASNNVGRGKCLGWGI